MKKLLALAVMIVPLTSFASSTCDEYFKSVDGYLDQIAAVPEMKTQLDALKAQYAQTKKQLEAMPAESQEASCKQGLEAMKMAEEQIKQAQANANAKG
ncbi:DUF5339 domain-containing protein [Citrobacter freundii]|uniref:DUF5339 domain-containing protein n=1 Tax=Citrobacter rodentium TaxID=67825 RepID=UPI0029324105|nr:DUF5339 domain-containing protein [Citrobacter freundii]ELT0895125.1 DUF5339 domain-containing protein [Citrobacter freundii]